MAKKPTPTNIPPTSLETTKLRLQIVQTAASVLGAIAILIAFFQWQDAQRRAEQDVYRTISKDWNDHLKFFVENPHLRPYFFSARQVDPIDPEADRIRGVADVRIDLMDAILTHMEVQGWTKEVGDPWRKTFHDAFRNSPVMCDTISETWSNYGLIVKIARDACRNAPRLPFTEEPPLRPRSPA